MRICLTNTGPNERTSGNGAVALWFHVQRPSRAVPECERWPMNRLTRIFALAVALSGMTGSAADRGDSRDFLTGVCTNRQWSRVISSPVTIGASTTAVGSAANLSQVRIRPTVEVAGVRLGMTREQVLSVWGFPHDASVGTEFGTGRENVRLVYSGFERQEASPIAHAIFAARTNAVVAMWLDCAGWYGKDSRAPKVEDCLRELGEPTLRNYIPEPLETRKQPPKHWYCRMVYKQLATVLYFGDGRLMALEVNPNAKGVAPEGQGSDEYSIPFCLE